jgi:polyhydroxyalkanoate synthase
MPPLAQQQEPKARFAYLPATAAGIATREDRESTDSRDSYSVTALADILDRSLDAAAARFTLGLSPAALTEACLDWAMHLAFSPGKQLQLVDNAARKALRFSNYLRRCAAESQEPCIAPLPQDRRLIGQEWQRWPYNVLHQAFLLQQQWWHNATTDISGVTQQHENIVSFVARQLLDVIAPSNTLLTNPEILRVTRENGGRRASRWSTTLVRMGEPVNGP